MAPVQARPPSSEVLEGAYLPTMPIQGEESRNALLGSRARVWMPKWRPAAPEGTLLRSRLKMAMPLES